MAEERETTANAPEQDLNEMMRIRREKMDAFRSMGVAPFGHRFEVTDYAAPLKEIILPRMKKGKKCVLPDD